MARRLPGVHGNASFTAAFMHLSGALRCGRRTGALLLPVEAAVSGEPGRTPARRVACFLRNTIAKEGGDAVVVPGEERID